MAILEHYPKTTVKYKFINRNKDFKISFIAYKKLLQTILDLEGIQLLEDEYHYLRDACPYLSNEYLDYLKSFRFNPRSQIKTRFSPSSQIDSKDNDKFVNIDSLQKNYDGDTLGGLDIEISGKWAEVILYEVPLLALISEIYYVYVDKDWEKDMDLQRTLIRNKTERLLENSCSFSEFGTRRRRSFLVQDAVVEELAKIRKTASQNAQPKANSFSESNKDGVQKMGSILGTSNVYLAKKYGIPPSGTVGHEWTMGTAAIEKTFISGNKLALYKWIATFKTNLGIALTDTFGIKSFFNNFDYFLANTFVGIRHDSGDPIALVDLSLSHYKKLGIDPSKKIIVFSDSLNADKAIQLQQICTSKGIGSAFGIGTNLTNDFVKSSNTSSVSPPLNIVIKLIECDGFGCVKLSDDPGKHTGPISDIQRAIHELRNIL
ncbi:hypothetical protein BB560_004621 [Smittium megazygosporum]|uniref:Nicotinate phosphoribosyltransferase n=1 Tax=Smittium megazygosporum TaxID=133381 RepID=A0A2T9Z8Q1_9FUNG|nr:hypothetical protein BB560_004621 [Smittium megazygosporum]